MIKTMQTGDRLILSRDAAILQFTGKRKVLSTTALNGGLRSDLQAVFNHNDCPKAGAYCQMRGLTMEDHQINTALSLELDPIKVTGMNTGANIDNMSIQCLGYEGYSVTAAVTAGVEINACRVGNEASLHEKSGEAFILGGTINILLVVDADLTDGCMTRALVTCTEAKVAALQELMVADRYSKSLATGSGTDGIIIVSNSESPVKLSEAGKPFKLGELIGKTVIKAIKEALYRQTGLCAEKQHHVFRRLERFGIRPEAVWNTFYTENKNRNSIAKSSFMDMLEKMDTDGTAIVIASLYAHLMDEILWGLLLPPEGADMGGRLLRLLNQHYAIKDEVKVGQGDTQDGAVEQMTQAFIEAIICWVQASME